MTDTPERIWAWKDKAWRETSWNDHGDKRYTPDDAAEYVRADLAAPEWLDIKTAPKDGDPFLVYEVGEFERTDWLNALCSDGMDVHCVKATKHAVTCFYVGGGFITEFGEQYDINGVVSDHEGDTVDDGVLRLGGWMPLTKPPTLDT